MPLHVELGRNKHNWFSQAGVIWFQHTTAVVFSLQLPNVKQGTILSNFLILSHPGSQLGSGKHTEETRIPALKEFPALMEKIDKKTDNCYALK